MAEYYGKLTDSEIELLSDKCPILSDKLKGQFIEAESVEKPCLENKYVETIKIQH